MAKQVPGKEEFNETLRYFARQIKLTGVDLQLNRRIESAEELSGYDDVILATGVRPRTPPIDGISHNKVLSYVDVLQGKANVGARVAIIGAGVLILPSIYRTTVVMPV